MVVVRGRDDQVGARDLIVLVDPVVVDQSAARRLDDTDAALGALALRYQIGPEQVVVMQQVLDSSAANSISIMRVQ